MAFFDELGANISSKGKDIAKKARDYADISKLNTQISSEEEIIRNTYSAIGEKYFEQNRTNQEDSFHTEFQTILDSMQKILELRKEITAIRGVTVCPNCGAEISAGACFCPGCGKKAEENIVSDTVEAPGADHCPSCGSPLRPDALFCGKCGLKRNVPQPENPAAEHSEN